MANPTSLLMQSIMPRSASPLPPVNAATQPNQQQILTLSDAQSFTNVLQRTGQVGGTQSGGSQEVSGVSLEQLRVNLMERLQQLPESSALSGKLGTLLEDSKSKISLLREAMQGVGGKSTSTDLRGRLSQMESEWYEVERIMKSDKTLSTGELLGLQARLYRVAQQIEVMSKVVDQATGGIKTILNTSV